eukprot:5239977-Lingulodinium_polyedra.AAC.1
MLRACDGRPMKTMRAQLSSNGRMHSTRGLLILAKQAGLIEELGSSAWKERGRVLRLDIVGAACVLSEPRCPLPKARSSAFPKPPFP